MKTLVIGYGNPLRRDDGAGPQTAGKVARWDLPDVRTRAVFQLLPEHAAELAAVDRVLFVDASANPAIGTYQARRLDGVSVPAGVSHFGHPGELLALARELYGRRPVAWLLTVPAADLGFGEGLSAAARAGMAAALVWVYCWLAAAGIGD
jgi:hydrogenase maturation protease